MEMKIQQLVAIFKTTGFLILLLNFMRMEKCLISPKMVQTMVDMAVMITTDYKTNLSCFDRYFIYNGMFVYSVKLIHFLMSSMIYFQTLLYRYRRERERCVLNLIRYYIKVLDRRKGRSNNIV